MLRGDQFIKSLFGGLEVDEVKKEATLKEFKEKYPYANVEYSNFNVAAVAKFIDDTYVCMKCGNKLTSRVNQYFKNGSWQEMKKKNNISNCECENCAPGVGGQTLAIYQNVAKD